MNRQILRIALVVGAALGLPANEGTAAAGSSQTTYFITYDDFQHGFSEAHTDGASAKWFYLSMDSFVGNDGVVDTGPLGLRVRAPGVNPVTQEPAFTLSVAPESQSGMPGGFDHVKWLVYSNQPASSGVPGFDAADNRELACQALVSGSTFGTEFHPFGPVIADPNDDLRLASFAMSTIDLETFMVFDMFLTNETIYAYYERLPFGRGPTLGNYAAFSYAVPVARYRPFEPVFLKVGYDKTEGVVRWYVNGAEVMKVDRIGFRLPDRTFMTLDHDGDETLVAPRQLACGMGTFTLLDGYLPSKEGLARLSSASNFYFDPSVGAPTPETFVDDQSLASSRLFGQGAELRVFRYWVSSLPR